MGRTRADRSRGAPNNVEQHARTLLGAEQLTAAAEMRNHSSLEELLRLALGADA
jgi:hypothetical protein